MTINLAIKMAGENYETRLEMMGFFVVWKNTSLFSCINIKSII